MRRLSRALIAATDPVQEDELSNSYNWSANPLGSIAQWKLGTFRWCT